MYIRLDRAHRALPVILGVITLASVVVLLAWDAFPGYFLPKRMTFSAHFHWP